MLLNCRGTLHHFTSPQVMGILNLTPDSFYDGGKNYTLASALKHTEKMVSEGATIIDAGGMSSKPGAVIISAKDEQERLLPVLQQLVKEFPQTLFSVDTLHSSTAHASLSEGAHIINDITAGTYDKDMLAVVATHRAPFIAMHMQGLPETMQQQPHYTHAVTEVYRYLHERKQACVRAGIKDVVIDPGFGFGKTPEHNYQLLKQLSLFAQLECPLLVGVSRKSMITRLLSVKPEQALNGTTALNTIALLNGAHILRVHDVQEAVEAVKIVQQLNRV